MRKQILCGMLWAGLVAAPIATLAPSMSYQAMAAGAARANHAASGFSIVPPAGWTAAPPGKDGSVMAYYAPPKDNFKTNFNVRVQKDPGAPLSGIGPALKPMFAKQMKQYNWKFVKDGFRKVGGNYESYFMSSLMSMNKIDIQNLQYYVRGRNGKVYIVTFTARKNAFAAHEAMFNKILDTMQAK